MAPTQASASRTAYRYGSQPDSFRISPHSKPCSSAQSGRPQIKSFHACRLETGSTRTGPSCRALTTATRVCCSSTVPQSKCLVSPRDFWGRADSAWSKGKGQQTPQPWNKLSEICYLRDVTPVVSERLRRQSRNHLNPQSAAVAPTVAHVSPCWRQPFVQVPVNVRPSEIVLEPRPCALPSRNSPS